MLNLAVTGVTGTGVGASVTSLSEPPESPEPSETSKTIVLTSTRTITEAETSTPENAFTVSTVGTTTQTTSQPPVVTHVTQTHCTLRNERDQCIDPAFQQKECEWVTVCSPVEDCTTKVCTTKTKTVTFAENNTVKTVQECHIEPGCHGPPPCHCRYVNECVRKYQCHLSHHCSSSNPCSGGAVQKLEMVPSLEAIFDPQMYGFSMILATVPVGDMAILTISDYWIIPGLIAVALILLGKRYGTNGGFAKRT